jgi:hypothetical protein
MRPSPLNKDGKRYPCCCSLSLASYDSQGYGGGILTASTRGWSRQHLNQGGGSPSNGLHDLLTSVLWMFVKTRRAMTYGCDRCLSGDWRDREELKDVLKFMVTYAVDTTRASHISPLAWLPEALSLVSGSLHPRGLERDTCRLSSRFSSSQPSRSVKSLRV